MNQSEYNIDPYEYISRYQSFSEESEIKDMPKTLFAHDIQDYSGGDFRIVSFNGEKKLQMRCGTFSNEDIISDLNKQTCNFIYYNDEYHSDNDAVTVLNHELILNCGLSCEKVGAKIAEYKLSEFTVGFLNDANGPFEDNAEWPERPIFQVPNYSMYHLTKPIRDTLPSKVLMMPVSPYYDGDFTHYKTLGYLLLNEDNEIYGQVIIVVCYSIFEGIGYDDLENSVVGLIDTGYNYELSRYIHAKAPKYFDFKYKLGYE